MKGNFADFPLWMKRESVASVRSVRHRRHISLSDLSPAAARPFESISGLVVLGRYCGANTKEKNPASAQNPIYKTIRLEYKRLPSR